MLANKEWFSDLLKAEGAIVASEQESKRGMLLPLPSDSLNWALGGGVEPGKILTAYGPEGSGKTLLALLSIASLQRSDPEAWAVWYDAEFSWRSEYAAKLGVDLNRVIVFQNNEATAIFDHFTDKVVPKIQEGAPIRLVAVDSIKSIIGPKESNLTSVTDHVMGDISVLLPKALKRWLKPIVHHNLYCILINQVNEELDPELARRGRKWRMPSGRALKHHSDYIVLVERVDSKKTKLYDDAHKDIRQDSIQVGHLIRCKVEKNRTDTPFLTSEFTLRYGVGVVNRHIELANLAIQTGAIEKVNQSTYKMPNGNTVRGAEAVATECLKEEIRRDVLSAIYKVRREYIDSLNISSDSTLAAGEDGVSFTGDDE